MAYPPQYTPSPHAPTPPPAPVPKNGLGTTSLVMGILSIVGSWIPFAGFGSYITSLIGIITGALGQGRAKKGLATNRGAATGGLVMSIIGLVSVVMATVFYTSVLYALGESTDTSKPAISQGSKADQKMAGIGETVNDGDMSFTVTRLQDGVTNIGGELGEDAQGQFVVVHVRVKNTGNEAAMFEASEQKVYDVKGREYSDAAAGILLDESNSFLEEINPGNTVKGKLVFDMPKNAQPHYIELHGSMFSEGVTVSLR